MQEPCSTLAGVGHFGHRFLAFWSSFLFVSLQKVLPDVMDTDSEMRLIDVPERSTEDLVITVNTEEVPRTHPDPGLREHRVKNPTWTSASAFGDLLVRQNLTTTKFR